VPAGKIEDGESPLEAVRREVFEETGIILPKAPFFLKRYFVSHPHLNFSYDAFRLTLDGHFSVRPDVLICDEHQAFGWFTLYDLLEKELIPDEFAVLCASPIFSRL
jgi:8-oxo-dGTP pyrophosphatase MutT (NUDIX family)